MRTHRLGPKVQGKLKHPRGDVSLHLLFKGVTNPHVAQLCLVNMTSLLVEETDDFLRLPQPRVTNISNLHGLRVSHDSPCISVPTPYSLQRLPCSCRLRSGSAVAM